MIVTSLKFDWLSRLTNIYYTFRFIGTEFKLVWGRYFEFNRSTHDYQEVLFDFMDRTIQVESGNDNHPDKKLEVTSTFELPELKPLKSIHKPGHWKVTEDHSI